MAGLNSFFKITRQVLTPFGGQAQDLSFAGHGHKCQFNADDVFGVTLDGLNNIEARPGWKEARLRGQVIVKDGQA